MKRAVLFIISMALLLLVACGDQSDTEDQDASHGTYSGLTLHEFTDDVQTCTPYLGASSLSDWYDWDPDNPDSVLGKPFDPDSEGDESIYSQIEILDNHIEMVNDFSDVFDESGDHTIGDQTATISTTALSVDVPFLSNVFPDLLRVPVERIVTITSGRLTLHMAFSINGTEETIIDHYEDGETIAGVYYTVRRGNHLWIWHASVRDRKVQFMWDGDTAGKTFRISMCTDAGTNWEVMGGGSVATRDSLMAFMARNDDTNTSEDKYYLTLTLGDFLDGNGDSVTIEDFEDTEPDGTGVLSYITESSELGGYTFTDCLNFFRRTGYPDSVEDLSWTN